MKPQSTSKGALKFRLRRLHKRPAADAGPISGQLSQLVWMNSADGANYLRQNTRHAFRMWAHRHGAPAGRQSVRCLVLGDSARDDNGRRIPRWPVGDGVRRVGLGGSDIPP